MKWDGLTDGQCDYYMPPKVPTGNKSFISSGENIRERFSTFRFRQYILCLRFDYTDEETIQTNLESTAK